MSAKSVEENFFERWNIYKKVIANNYMYHSEIISSIKEKITHMESLSVLDLGCGDSYVAANSISSGQLQSYLGIDTSETAINFSKNNLSNHRGDVAHINGDLSELDDLRAKYDLIIAGYSLHHLRTEEKGNCISRISDLLSQNGFFLLLVASKNYGLLVQEL